MKIKIAFAMTKGEGTFPDLSLLTKNQQNSKYIKSCMTLIPAFEDVNDAIETWDVIDDGLDNIKYSRGEIHGYPTPTIQFILNQKMDKKEFLRGVWMTSYKLEIPNINDGDPYFFEDHNGYSKIVK